MSAAVAERLRRVQDDIQKASADLGREPPTLIAVSKRHSTEAIREAYAAGQRDFGENYVQELERKARALADLSDLRWHLIGPAQRNKARVLSELRPLVHTLGSARLLEALQRRCSSPIDALIQVNLAEEAQKYGVDRDQISKLIEMSSAGTVQVQGLMIIPPAQGDPSPWYEELRDLAIRYELPELSMGMSGDWRCALRCGATFLRIGTAIFGARPAPSATEGGGT